MKSVRATTWLLLVAGLVGAGCCQGWAAEPNFPSMSIRPAQYTQDVPYARRNGVAPDPILSPDVITRFPPTGDVDGVIQRNPMPEGVWVEPLGSPTWIDRFYDLMPEGMICWGPRTPYERRHSGLGDPLEGISWLDHQESAGAFGGPIFGAASTAANLDPGAGWMFGLRFCWDYDHRWGLEKRFSFAQMYVLDLARNLKEIVNLEMGDIDLMFYPWGDSRWRPYIMTGVGAANFNYQDASGKRTSHGLISIPFGIGLKYLYSEGVAFRLDVTDNLLLGSGDVTTMNNMSVTAGVEFRFDIFTGNRHASSGY